MFRTNKRIGERRIMVKEIEYFLIGLTKEETAKEFMELVKKRLGEGVNSWRTVKTLEELKEEIDEELEKDE